MMNLSVSISQLNKSFLFEFWDKHKKLFQQLIYQFIQQALRSDGSVIMTARETPGFSWLGKILQVQPLTSQVNS